MSQSTLVVFRKWPGTNQIIALMPELPSSCSTWVYCDSFALHEGHGSADPDIVRITEAATPEEYAATKEAMERNYGYVLRIGKRIARTTAQVRREAWGKLCNPLPSCK